VLAAGRVVATASPACVPEEPPRDRVMARIRITLPSQSAAHRHADSCTATTIQARKLLFQNVELSNEGTRTRITQAHLAKTGGMQPRLPIWYTNLRPMSGPCCDTARRCSPPSLRQALSLRLGPPPRCPWRHSCSPLPPGGTFVYPTYPTESVCRSPAASPSGRSQTLGASDGA